MSDSVALLGFGIGSGTTYEWAGTPHASESIKRVDGVEVARNLSLNPSSEAEAGLDAPFGAEISFSNEASVVGDYSSTILATTSQGICAASIKRVTVEAGREYIVQVSVRSGTQNSATAILDPLSYWYDASGTTIAGDNWTQQRGPSDEWQTISATLTAPEGADSMDTRFIIHSLEEGDFFYLDAIIVELSDTFETYFDGDTPDQVVGHGDPIRVVQNAVWLLDDRADSTNQVRVTTSLAEADGVDAEQELIFKGRRFVISEVERDRAADQAAITADEAQAALADIVLMDFKPNNWTLTSAMEHVLADTRWTIGDATGIRFGQAHFDEITVLDALHFLARHQDAHLSFDSLRRRVNVTQLNGTNHEYVFTYGRQLSNIEKSTQQPVTTVVYPTMSGTDEDVVLDPVEDYGYYLSQGLSLTEARARFRKEEYWDDRRYEIAENMIRDAEKRLAEEAWPSVTYTLTAQATVSVDGVDDFDLAELHLGDQVYVWDQEIDTKLSAEVTAVTTSSDQSQNELTLSTLPASLGDSLDSRGYFGDSGSPATGDWARVVPLSGPQPTPSMPIRESINSLGVGAFRWNGQDEHGDYDTIPARFGHVRPVAAEVVDGVVPSPESADAFGGTTITTYDGGTCIVSFGAPGEYAVWFQMVGADGQTVSEHSEPWVGEVDEHVDTGAIEQDLADARERLDQAEADFTEGNEQRKAEIDHLREVRIPDLEDALTTGLDDVYAQAQDYAEQQASDAVNQAAANAQSEYDRLQELAEKALSRAGDNVLEDPSFETDYWVNQWDGTGGRSAQTTVNPNRTGGYALVLGEGSSPTDFEFPDIGVELDQSYRMTIWYRTWGSNLADLSAGESVLVFYDSDTGAELAVSEPLTVGSTYRRAQVVYTVPEGVQSIRPAIRASWPTGIVVFDDVSVREVGAAAEALRLAEVARQQAEAAHVAAGNAVDTAASAYDAASSKSTVHWSLSAPSGTADNTDDVWWQYELRNGRRVVIGQWFWDDGVWRETEIAEEWLPVVNIGTGTYGDLDGDRLTANSVKTNHLLVGPRNIITDLNFADINEGSIEDGWGSYTGGWETVNMSWSDRPIARVSTDALSDDESKYLHYGGSGPSSASLPCEPGERFKARFQVLRYSGWSSDDDYRAHFRWVDAEGNGVNWSTYQFSGYSNESWAEFEATAPEGAAWFYFRFAKVGVAAARRGVGNLSIQKMTGGDLIVDGGIISRHVDTEEFFAAEAVIDQLSVSTINALEATAERGFIGGALLEDDSITVGKLYALDEIMSELARFLRVQVDHLDFNRMVGMAIESGLIEGGTVRGALIETIAQAAREIKIDGNGISGYNSSGTRNFHVNTSGHLTAQNATVEGHILAQSARLIGELRVGRSGVTEGGIIPADNNSRIRLIGRLPDNMSANDTFTVGYTPYRHYGSVWGWTTVNYAVPTPFGGRIPMVTANMDETYQTARPGMILNTRSRSESSFVILWHTNIRQGPEDPRMSFSYFATWGRGTPSS